jgi:transcriptional regulator with XRE-family HTH domain
MAIGTTRGKRRLGRYVTPIIKRSELRAEEIAKQVRCSKQSVYRLQSGDALPRLHLLGAILGVIGATDDEREKAVQLWEIADSDTATIEFAQDLPVRYMRFRMDEAEAVRERTLDMVIMPGMLQTVEYATALWSAARRLIRKERWEERAIAERRDRQELLWRKDNPLELHALIDEAALRRIIGSRAVMVAQLDHLIRMGELPNVTIQVLPLDLCASGPYSGTMILLSYPESDEPDSAYVESMAGGETVGDDESVTALSDVWNAIAAAAPSPQRSVKIIKAVRGELKGR